MTFAARPHVDHKYLPCAAQKYMLRRMNACQHCGAPLKDEQAFCPNCGEPVNPTGGRSPNVDGEATITGEPAHDEAAEGVLDIWWDNRPERE
jgi:zinc-ribbon domain